MKRKGGRIALRAVLITVIGLVIGLTVYSFNARRLVGNNLPMPFGIGMSVILSGSMEPTLSVNDLVLVRQAETYAPGDVVVFQDRTGDLVIHRLKDVRGQTAVTRGDANDTDDEPIALEQIKGKLLFSVPFLGLIARGLKTLPGVLIVLAAAVFLMYRSLQNERAEADLDLEQIKEEIRRLRAQTPEQTAEGSDRTSGLKPEN